MTPEQRKLICTYNENVSGKPDLRLILTKDPRSEALERFCDALQAAGPRFRFEKKRDDDAPAPAIRIGGNLRYLAVPRDHKLEPFLEAVTALGEEAPRLSAAVRKALDGASLPAPIKVYIAPHCPFCPQTVRMLTPLAFAGSLVHVTVIDGTLFTEMAEADNIQSAPTVILDNQFRWTGTPDPEEIVNMIVHRDPDQLSPASLENLLTGGDAGRVAEMMLEREHIFPAFLELLMNEKWSVRLGAMVAMEKLIADNRRLAARAVDPIWERFGRLPDRVQGDMAYIFGELGEKALIGKLETVLAGSYGPEVKEAAAEAIQQIRHPSSD
jgi:alkyl hydroperoxide reductase subunit AhpF